MNPEVAFKLFPSSIYNHNFEITTCHRTIKGKYAVKVPIFSEFKNYTYIEFLILPWHKKFDCLLGFKDLVSLKCNIDVRNECLVMPQTKIYYQKDIDKSNKIISPIKNGEVLVPSIKLKDNTILPEVICNVNNYEVIYPYDLNNLHINNITSEPLTNFELAKKIDEPKNSSKLQIDKVIRTNHMNCEEKAKIIKLCYEFRKVFYNPEEKLSVCNATSHSIRTQDNDPIYIKNFRYPYHLKNEIQKQVRKFLDNEIIRPSISPYSNPVWIPRN